MSRELSQLKQVFVKLENDVFKTVFYLSSSLVKSYPAKLKQVNEKNRHCKKCLEKFFIAITFPITKE